MHTLPQHEKELCKQAIDNARILKNEQNVTQLEQELADCKAALAASEKSLSAYKDQLQICEREIIAKKSELDESGSILVERLMQNMQLQQQLVSAEEETDRVRLDARASRDDLCKMEEALANVKRDLDTARTVEKDLTTHRHTLAETLNTCNLEVAALKAQLASAEKETDRVRLDARASREDLCKMEEDLKASREEAAALKSQLASVESEVAHMPRLQKELEAVKVQLSISKSRMAVVQEELLTLHSVIESGKKDLVALKEGLHIFIQENDALRTQLVTARKQAGEIEQESSLSQQELAWLRNDIDALIKHFKTENVSELRTAFAEIQDVVKSSKEISAQLQASVQENSSLADQMDTLLAEKNAMKKELQSRSNCHAIEVQALNCDLAAMREEVKEAQERIQIRERELHRSHQRTCERLERVAAEEQERMSTKMNELEQQVEHLQWQLDREQDAVSAERQRSEHSLSNMRNEIEEQRVKMQEEMISEQKRMEDESNASLQALQVMCVPCCTGADYLMNAMHLNRSEASCC